MTHTTERDLMPDLVRAVALMGIVVVNAMVFASPLVQGFSAEQLATPLDRSVYGTMIALAFSKAYPLFSFMFGAGLAYQMQSASRAGARSGPRYARRMIGLLVLGILHVLLAFMGDVLIYYAVLGSFLWLMRDVAPKTLRTVAIVFLTIMAVLILLSGAAFAAFEAFAPKDYADVMADVMSGAAEERRVFTEGSFLDVVRMRIRIWSESAFGIILMGPAMFAFFLLGLSAQKTGSLRDPHARIWRRGLVWMWPGLAVNILGAWLISRAPDVGMAQEFLGTGLIVAGAPLLVWGWLGLVAAWARGPDGPVRRFIARAGSATLTAYLLQSLILSLVFCGYGLGFYGKLGAAATIGIGALAGVVSIILASLWMARFSRGPVEALLRAWTYLGSNRASAQRAASATTGSE